MPPTPPAPPVYAPRDVSTGITDQELSDLRRHALDLANGRVSVGGQPNARESDAERRHRVTADAAAYVDFLLRGKISDA